MPWLKGRLPVAIVVHSIGEKDGCNVVRRAVHPALMRRWMLGILPAAISGRMTFQSAASQPTRRTLRRLSGIRFPDGVNSVRAAREIFDGGAAWTKWKDFSLGRDFV